MSLRSRSASLGSGVLPAGPQVEAGVPEEPVLLQAARSARAGAWSRQSLQDGRNGQSHFPSSHRAKWINNEKQLGL